MKKIKTLILAVGLLLAVPLSAPILFVASDTYAADCKLADGSPKPNCCLDSDNQEVVTSVLGADCAKVQDSVNGGRGIIWDLLTIAINFLAAGIGLVVLAGIVFGAVTYATSAGSAEQAKKGISFITNAVIALLLFIFMYAIINFLVPGGLF